MRQRMTFACVLCILLASLASVSEAAPPADVLLPNATEGYLSVPDVDRMDELFSRTQWGRLLDDPIMQPFAEDFRRQMRSRFGGAATLGLEWQDVNELATGELCLAYVNLPGDHPARTVIIDVTDNLDDARAVVAKATKNLREMGAKQTTQKVGGVTITTLELPKAKDRRESERWNSYFIHDNILCAAQSPRVARDVLGRFTGEHKDNLANLPAYRAVMDRCGKDAGKLAPQARFFVDFFDYIAARRTDDPSLVPANGIDMIEVLRRSGFTAIKGFGGLLHLAVGNHDAELRVKIYAPPPFTKSMKMVELINGGDQLPAPWVLNEIATYISANLKTLVAFDNFGPVFDEVVAANDGGGNETPAGEDEESVWLDVLDSLKHDKNGPRIDLRGELFVHLSDRVTMITDYKLPITPKSERRVRAIKAKDVAKAAKAIEKLMKDDPTVRVRKFGRHVIYEVVDDQRDVPQLRVEGPSRGPRRRPSRERPAVQEERRPRQMAICVAHGHLFVASHVDFLVKVLGFADGKNPRGLAKSVDYRVVAKELEAHLKLLGASDTCARIFSHTAAQVRPTYELTRQGKMGESETMTGRLLNQLLGSPEQKGPRKQEIDGSKLPEFERVRRFFGPAGGFLRTEADGWYFVGLTYTKDAHVAAVSGAEAAR